MNSSHYWADKSTGVGTPNKEPSNLDTLILSHSDMVFNYRPFFVFFHTRASFRLKDSGAGNCSYSMICFILIVQCMSLGVIYCMLSKPLFVYRIINFLIDSFQPSLELIQPLAIFSPCPLTKTYLLVYSFPSPPPQIILPAPLNSSQRMELLTPKAVKEWAFFFY